jgi:hypothetical protein
LGFLANKNSNFAKEISQKNENIENLLQEKLRNEDLINRLNQLNKENSEKDKIINTLKSNINNKSNKFYLNFLYFK